MLVVNQAAKVAYRKLSVQSQNGQKLSSFPLGNREPAVEKGFKGSAQGVQSSNAVKGTYKHKFINCNLLILFLIFNVIL